MKMKDKKVLQMVQLTILIAIVLLMSFTPLGYLKTVWLDISLLTIPVAVGAMILGPLSGTILGAVFGLTSFWRCVTGMTPAGAILLAINPFYTFLLCVPTRMLVGCLTGLLFRSIYRFDKTKTVSYFVGGLCGALLNTILYMGAMLLFFWHTDYMQELAAGRTVMAYLVASVGLNVLLEAPTACLVGGIIAKAVNKALNYL